MKQLNFRPYGKDVMRSRGFETYEVSYCCRNCGRRQVERIEKGKTAPSTVVCNNCGCRTRKYVPW